MPSRLVDESTTDAGSNSTASLSVASEIPNHDLSGYNHHWPRLLILVLLLGTTLALLLTPGFVSTAAMSLLQREGSGGLLHPAMLTATILVFLWERYYPVGNRPVSGPAQVNDLIWWLTNATLAVGAPVLAAIFFQRASSAVTADAEPFDLFAGLPWLLRYLIAVLAVDLVRYGVHVCRHKIRILWRFHATHHSTIELNQFSAYRLHPIDYGVSVAIAAIPFGLFSVPVEGFVLYQVFTGVLGRTHHAAVCWRWPILNWFLVSPQAHRVHHSTNQEHYDKNYGLTFSIWDRIFGTYHDPQTYDPTPITGVPGLASPEASRYREVLLVYVHQLLAPFRRMD